MGATAMADPQPRHRVNLLDGYSFEISAKDAHRLESVRAQVPAGTLVSITYLPNETDDQRIAAACEARRVGLAPMPHIAARRIPSAASLERFLAAVTAQAGVDRVFVIAGDLAAPIGPYEDALAVIGRARLADFGIRTVGFSGYPEGHPQIPQPLLEHAMAEKAEALDRLGLDGEIMTQFAFDADPMVAWVAKLRADGIRHRIRLGLPGPANVGTLLRFAARCGVGASAKVMAKYGASITRLLSTAGPDRLYADLSAGIDPIVHGPVAVHLYPFGGLQKMADWVNLNAPTA